MTNDTSVPLAHGPSEFRADEWEAGQGRSNIDGDSSLDFTAIRGMVWRQRFIFLITVPVAIALGFIITLLITPKYQATSTLQVDTNPVVIVDGQDQAPTARDIRAYKETLARVVKSRSVAARVVDTLKLTNRLGPDDSDKPEAMSSDVWAGRKREATINTLLAGLTVEPDPDANVVTISYTSADPNLAARIANAYTNAVLADELSRNLSQSEYAREYLQDQITQLQGKLSEAEQQSIAYARQNRIVSGSLLGDGDADSGSSGGGGGGGGGGLPSTVTGANLLGINMAYGDAKNRRIAAQQRWEEVRNRPASSLAEVQASSAVQNLISDRSKAMAELADMRTRYGEDYPPARELKARLATIDAQIRKESEAIKSSIEVAYETAVRQENAFSTEVGKVSDDTLDEQSRRVLFGQLSREAASYRAQLDAMMARYNALAASANIKPSTLTKLDDAQVPAKPISPDMSKNLLIAALLGIGLAGAVAILREIFDNRLRSVSDVERKLGLSALGVTPMLDADEVNSKASVLREAYTSISTGIEFALPTTGANLIAVTSSRGSEGKSTSSIMIATTLASHGRRILLIDGDLRKPSIASQAGFRRPEIGLPEVLLGKVSLEDALLPNIQENLDILPTGSIPAQPAEILSSPRFVDFLEKCRQDYSLVIIDTPPVIGIADAPIIANLADGTIFVIEANEVDVGMAKAALRRLRNADTYILGAILTKFNSLTTGQSYKYDYTYYEYGSKE